MSDTPLISVVVPTYNRAQSTIAAIESIIGQTYTKRELIVIDDGSTDGSDEVLRRFTSQRVNGCDQIRYFSQPNQGPSAARNAGISKARGEYIAFLDSDDFWFPEKLEWQVRTIEQFESKCGACFTDTQLVDSSGTNTTTFQAFRRNYKQTIGIEPDPVRSIAKSFCGFWISTLLVRADLIKQIGGFDPDVHFAEDRDFYFRLSLIAPLAYVNRPLARTDRSASPSGSTCRPWEKVEVRLRAIEFMLEKWLRMGPAVPPDVYKIVERNLRSVHSEWTNWYLETKHYREARHAVSKAIRYEATPQLTVKWMLTWVAPALARKITPLSKPYL